MTMMDSMAPNEVVTMVEAVNRYGYNAQVTKAIEELGELTQVLAKWLNGHAGEFEALEDHIAEELADVWIMSEQLRIIFNNYDDVYRWKTAKLARLRQLLDHEDDVEV